MPGPFSWPLRLSGLASPPPLAKPTEPSLHKKEGAEPGCPWVALYRTSCQGPSHGHVEEHPLSGLLQAQGLSLLVDVGDHELSRLQGIGLEGPHAFVHLLVLFEEVLREGLAPQGGEGGAEDGIDTGCDEVLADGEGLLAH